MKCKRNNCSMLKIYEVKHRLVFQNKENKVWNKVHKHNNCIKIRYILSTTNYFISNEFDSISTKYNFISPIFEVSITPFI